MVGKIASFFASRAGIVTVGAIIGVVAPLLQHLGNPPNMGVCVACFERDTAGALGLHRASVVQYIRPEIIGFVLGSILAALTFREFRARNGSTPIVRFRAGHVRHDRRAGVSGLPLASAAPAGRRGSHRGDRALRSDRRHCRGRLVSPDRLLAGPEPQDLRERRPCPARDDGGPAGACWCFRRSSRRTDPFFSASPDLAICTRPSV